MLLRLLYVGMIKSKIEEVRYQRSAVLYQHAAQSVCSPFSSLSSKMSGPTGAVLVFSNGLVTKLRIAADLL